MNSKAFTHLSQPQDIITHLCLCVKLQKEHMRVTLINNDMPYAQKPQGNKIIWFWPHSRLNMSFKSTCAKSANIWASALIRSCCCWPDLQFSSDYWLHFAIYWSMTGIRILTHLAQCQCTINQDKKEIVNICCSLYNTTNDYLIKEWYLQKYILTRN